MSDNRNSGEGLQKRLSPLNVWALALGSIIGWGAFVMPANTFLPNAGPLGTAIAMVAAALIMIVIALNYSYMINRFPVAGGEFTFTNASFGPICGFLCAWFAVLPCHRSAERYRLGAHRAQPVPWSDPVGLSLLGGGVQHLRG